LNCPAPKLAYIKKSQYISHNKTGGTMSGIQSRNVYTKEFKKETVLLVLERGMTVSQVSEDLEIGTEYL